MLSHKAVWRSSEEIAFMRFILRQFMEELGREGDLQTGDGIAAHVVGMSTSNFILSEVGAGPFDFSHVTDAEATTHTGIIDAFMDRHVLPNSGNCHHWSGHGPSYRDRPNVDVPLK